MVVTRHLCFAEHTFEQLLFSIAHTLSTHSDLPWYKVFYRAMDKISDLKLDHQNEVVEPFLCGLREHPIPTPGVDTILSVVPKGVDSGQVCVNWHSYSICV